MGIVSRSPRDKELSVASFDVGKTGCRAALFEGSRRIREVSQESAGAPIAAIDAAASRLSLAAQSVDAAAVGIAGLGQVWHQAAAIAEHVAEMLSTRRVVVASDMTTSHAGALLGDGGVVVAAGTGAVALAVGQKGHTAQTDGWGYLLGDDGSGFAIGRAGLRSALCNYENRGGSPTLRQLAEARYGSLQTMPGLIQSAANPAREVAAFAVDVARAARNGDPEATSIWRNAATALADTAVAAAGLVPDPGTPIRIAITGGISKAEDLTLDPFTTRINELLPGTRLQKAAGDALDGGRILATSPGGLHESLTFRLCESSQPAERDRSVATGSLPVTELPNPDSSRLDEMPVEDILSLMNREDRRVPEAIAHALPQIRDAVDLLVEIWRRGGRWIYVGAGSSGRIAAMDAAECAPTFSAPPDRIQTLIAGGSEALVQAVEGTEDDGHAAVRDLDDISPGPKDVVIGVAASGSTTYTVAAVEHASRLGCATIGIVNNPGTRLSRIAQVGIEVVAGPEVVTGSTRLKAGTAQKLVLNMLSTTAFARLGKVYGNRMVDLQVTNDKLERRARRIVSTALGIPESEAAELLRASDGDVKAAIVMGEANVSAEVARELLSISQGSVRQALDAASRSAR